jgi:cytochrome P450
VTDSERFVEATCLSGAIYYLLKNPSKYETLVEEVRCSFGSHEKMTLEKLSSLKYLNAST